MKELVREGSPYGCATGIVMYLQGPLPRYSDRYSEGGLERWLRDLEGRGGGTVLRRCAGLATMGLIGDWNWEGLEKGQERRVLECYALAVRPAWREGGGASRRLVISVFFSSSTALFWSRDSSRR